MIINLKYIELSKDLHIFCVVINLLIGAIVTEEVKKMYYFRESEAGNTVSLASM